MQEVIGSTPIFSTTPFVASAKQGKSFEFSEEGRVFRIPIEDKMFYKWSLKVAIFCFNLLIKISYKGGLAQLASASRKLC
jgi:hypothetical protein